MTEITLKLTFEELKQIDKYLELNDETRPLFDKIRNAYPKPETLLDVIRNLGYSYDCCYEIVDAVEKFEKSKEPEKWDVVRESVKWCEEHREESVEDYLTPQERGDRIHKEVENEIEKLQEKNWYVDGKDLIKEWGEKNKPPTLYEILMEWWINHLDMEQSDEEIVDGLVDMIDKKFIPPSRDRNGYEWEKCLKMMRDKLRQDT